MRLVAIPTELPPLQRLVLRPACVASTSDAASTVSTAFADPPGASNPLSPVRWHARHTVFAVGAVRSRYGFVPSLVGTWSCQMSSMWQKSHPPTSEDALPAGLFPSVPPAADPCPRVAQWSSTESAPAASATASAPFAWHITQLSAGVYPTFHANVVPTGGPVSLLWHTVALHVPFSSCVPPPTFQFTPADVFAVSVYTPAPAAMYRFAARFWCRPLPAAPPPPLTVYADAPRDPDTLYVASPWQ